MQTRFFLGDEWIYYKLYCGKRTADHILVDIIKPFTEKLLKENLITKWFFIRYHDPNHHLRVRFHCEDLSKIGTIINTFKNAIDHQVANDFIWKVQTDTYQREIERYGKLTMIGSEDLFFHDSSTSINALNLIEDEELLFLFVLKSIDALLSVFEYDLKAKISFSKVNLTSYRNEFKAEKNFSKQLNIKYQKLRPKVESFMALKESSDYDALLNLITTKNREIETIKTPILELHKNNKLEVPLNHLLSSYIHMMVNRQFRDKQRLFELVCYDCLFRYYNSLFAKQLN